MREAGDGLCTIELEDKGEVFVECDLAVAIQVFTERRHLPVAALIFAEIENLEGFAVFDFQQTFASRMTAKRPKSQPIQRRPSFSATARVVPEPQKKSATKSPSFEEALMMRSRRDSGFCVS